MYELPVLLLECEEPVDEDLYRDVSVTVRNVTYSFTLDGEHAQWHLHGSAPEDGSRASYTLRFSFPTDVLGMGEAKRWILLSESSDSSLLRNRLMLDLSGRIGTVYSPESCFIELYINGEYQGVYLLAEAPEIDSERVAIRPAKEEFLFEVLSPDKDSSDATFTTPVFGLRFALNDIRFLPPDQKDWLTDFFTGAENAILSGEKDSIAKYLDLDSMVSGYILYEFSKKPDFAARSTRFLIEDGKLYCGAAWDFELSCGNTAVDTVLYGFNGADPSTTDGWYAVGLWYRELVGQEWFCELLSEAYQELQPWLVNLYEDNDLGTNQIDLLSGSMAEALSHNRELLDSEKGGSPVGGVGDGSSASAVEQLRDWLRLRNEWILSQLEKEKYPSVTE